MVIHYDITMGSDVAMDIHCDVTMSNDITICIYHVSTMHNGIAMNLFYYVFSALCLIIHEMRIHEMYIHAHLPLWLLCYVWSEDVNLQGSQINVEGNFMLV